MRLLVRVDIQSGQDIHKAGLAPQIILVKIAKSCAGTDLELLADKVEAFILESAETRLSMCAWECHADIKALTLSALHAEAERSDRKAANLVIAWSSIMPASLRIEIFPSNLRRMIDFYSNMLQFKLVKHESNYAYLKRDSVFIGAIETPSSETFEEKESYRRPNRGIEIVIEVDDLEKERDFIVSKGSTLDADIASQPWGLKDFRLVDPDGYYLRITTHSLSRTDNHQG